MRAEVIALVAGFGLMVLAAPVQASPVAPLDPAAGPPPAVTLVRDGCGPGWHARWWRDRWGRPHRRCVPNRRYW